MQEGIRFPVPNEAGKVYGSNGADLILSWGEKSAAYFRQLGFRSVVTGCPRYDDLLKEDFTEPLKVIDKSISWGTFNILFASNPIDDLGFCSTDEKLGLFEKFLLFARSHFPENTRVLLRLHPREDIDAFRSVINKLNLNDFVVDARSFYMFALFKRVQLTVIFASTVGLEALIFGARLCVIKLPRHGYAFDYVSSGVALPLDLDNTASFSLRNIPEETVRSYWQSYVAYPGQSARRIADMIEGKVNR